MTTKTINLKEYIGSECYTKLETWTQTEITNAINNAIRDAELFQVVENLPTTNIKNNKIYLVLSDSPSSGNLFNVYLYVNNAWERLDGLDFNINDYYLKSETDDLLDEKVDKENGKSLTSNDFTNAYKTKLDNLETTIANSIGNLQLITVVTSLPTTDIKTNRLYLLANDKSISENLYSIYIYVNNKWEQIDKLEFDITNYYTKSETDNLLDGKCDNDDNRLTNARTPLSHTHGNIANTGAIGSAANLPIITTTNGKLTTGSFGTTANTFCQGNDSRLSDARTPTAHTHSKSDITDFPTIDTSMSDSSTNLVQNKIIKSYVDDQIDDVISGAVDLTGYVKDTDSRLTDARTPLAHTHGDITNTGAIGTTANKPLITSTNGKIVTGSFGKLANTFAEGNHIHEWDDLNYWDRYTGWTMLESDGEYTISAIGISYDTYNEDLTFPCRDLYDVDGVQLAKISDIPSTSNFITKGSTTNLLLANGSNIAQSTFATSSHAHGNVTNDGKIGTASGKLITTGTGGALQASDSITKSMISDFPSSMTPTSHASTSTTYGVASTSNYGHAKASSSTPAAVTTGTASVGTDNGLYARADHSHKHPTYTSRTSNVYKITVDGSGHVSAATAPSLTYSNGLLTIGSTGTSGGW